ncbi:MAG: hypothetical protein JXB04_04635, partial [Kiritimatiellae bacterium]|nr:hypothetical protein [Kiritimatiellia bacterium]
MTSSEAAWSGTDAELVAMVESNNWDYFQYNQGGPYLLFRGSGHYDEQISYDPLATCAGDGFGIAALVVGAYRGWMSDETAYTRILELLHSYDNDLQRDGDMFFNHFYTFDTGLPQAEYSGIDSTWFLCGAILAAEYFKGTEVETIANHIYDSFEYSSVGPLWNMYFEYTIINIVGSGSPTNGWSAGTAQAAWESCTRATPSYMEGPLFWYQWPQAFVDFRHRVDSLGTNHFNIAMNAYLHQRDKCISLHNADPVNYPDFGTNGWGLTSATASKGYLELRPFPNYCTANTNYGVVNGCASGVNWIATDEDACDSGTLVPICLPACMSHTPYEAREAMKYLYDTYDPTIDIYGCYSFLNAFNTGAATSSNQHYSLNNATMDWGCNVVVIENFRSGMPWKYFMAHPYIAQGMLNCGFSVPSLPYHDDWNDGGDPNTWTGSTTYANSDSSNPTCTYESITWYNEWVNGYARKLVANGSGDVVRIGLNETDQSKKDLLSFWLRGENGGEQFDVGLRDAEGHEVLLPVTNYVEGGVVPTNWTRIRIPLRPLAVSGNPNNDVRIIFLGDFTVRFLGAGTVFIEDLAFVDDDWAPPPPTLGAACVDGRVHLRWGYSTHDDVVGYHLWRRPDDVSGFERINTSLLAADHDEIDARVESDWGEDYFYAVQCVDRRGNAGAFSSGPYERRVWIGQGRDVDYGDGANPNTFGGSHGWWDGGGGWGDVAFTQQTGHDGRTRWVRVVEGNTGGGGWIGLGGGSLGPYEALSFWMKQNWDANDFDIGLKSTNYVEVSFPVTRYAAVTDSWTYVIIPLVDFQGVDFAAMDNLSFTFNSPGSFRIDEIRFIRLDRASDQLFLREGEAAEGYVGGNTNDFKWYASRTFCLGNS